MGNVYDVVVEVEEEPPPTLGAFVQAYGVAPTSAPAPTAPTTLKAPANEDKVLRAPISGTVTEREGAGRRGGRVGRHACWCSKR